MMKNQVLFTNSSELGGSFKKEFKLRLDLCNELTIAAGYFGVSILKEYENALLRVAKKGNFRLLVGMIYHGGCARVQADALKLLDKKLKDINPKSGIFISRIPYHGKVYDFSIGGEDYLYIGSSNFSEDGLASRYECTSLVRDQDTKLLTRKYIAHLFDGEISKPLDKVELRVSKKSKPSISKELKDYKIDSINFPDASKSLGSFKIKLRVDDQPRSSLNLTFDKGRKNPQTGLYSPRPWYEVEITTLKSEREGNKLYPQKGEFTMFYNDDGTYYKIKMLVCSDGNKAIQSSESSGGRATLGKLIKGKLQRAGVLKEGDLITSDVLLEYGRDDIEFIKISKDEYIMKF